MTRILILIRKKRLFPFVHLLEFRQLLSVCKLKKKKKASVRQNIVLFCFEFVYNRFYLMYM